MSGIIITGKTNSKGQYAIHNKGMLDDYCRKNPNKTLVFEINAIGKGTKESLLNAYYGIYLPEWVKGMFNAGTIITEPKMDELLRNRSPVTESKTLSQLNYDEMLVFMDSVKLWALEDVNIFLEEPRCL